MLGGCSLFLFSDPTICQVGLWPPCHSRRKLRGVELFALRRPRPRAVLAPFPNNLLQGRQQPSLGPDLPPSTQRIRTAVLRPWSLFTSPEAWGVPLRRNHLEVTPSLPQKEETPSRIRKDSSQLFCLSTEGARQNARGARALEEGTSASSSPADAPRPLPGAGIRPPELSLLPEQKQGACRALQPGPPRVPHRF